MKASRLTAVGLVAAAGLWIASGHFLPHESAESRAAVRSGEGEAKKLFRVAVVGTTVVPHSRKLVVAGRTEADKRVTLTARTGGILTELRIKRGSWVQKGEIIAVLSDEAREAQVAQAEAVVTQKRTEIEAKRALILTGTLPRLQLVDLEAQVKAAEAALAGAAAERDRGVVRAPWSGVVHDVAVEVGQAAFSFAGRELATLVALDPMLAVVEVAERKLAGIKVGDRRDRKRQNSLRRQNGEPDHAHLSGRNRIAECRRQDPGRHHGGGRHAPVAVAGNAHRALRTHLFLERQSRRTRRWRRRHGRVRARQRDRGRPRLHVGHRHRRGQPRDRAGTGFRA
jgi:multidrug efflux system membrane fusion protein